MVVLTKRPSTPSFVVDEGLVAGVWAIEIAAYAIKISDKAQVLKILIIIR